jgi:hypothetical protein
VFGNRVLRRLFGPKRDEVTGEWRKLHNEALNDMYPSPTIAITIIIIIIYVLQLGHWLTRSGLTSPEASSKVCHDSFYQSGSSVSLSWVVYCAGDYREE